MAITILLFLRKKKKGTDGRDDDADALCFFFGKETDINLSELLVLACPSPRAMHDTATIIIRYECRLLLSSAGH